MFETTNQMCIYTYAVYVRLCVKLAFGGRTWHVSWIFQN